MNIFAWVEDAAQKFNLTYLVIGGVAVNVYGYGRITKDLDLMVCGRDLEAWRNAFAQGGLAIIHESPAFLQIAEKGKDGAALDLMIVNQTTFSKMLVASKPAQYEGKNFSVPKLEHLIALKLHALKHGGAHRRYKDLTDVLALAAENQIDVGGDSFRTLCDKYGSRELYEQITAFRGK